MKKTIIIATILATSIAAQAADKEFTSRDKNNDGMISVAEWVGTNKNSRIAEYVAKRTKTHQRIDSDADGQISEEEWTARKNKRKNKSKKKAS